MKKIIAVIFGVAFPLTSSAYACCGDNYTQQHLLAYIIAFLSSAVVSCYLFKKFFPEGNRKKEFAIVNIFSDFAYLSSITLVSYLNTLLFHPFSLYQVFRYLLGMVLGKDFYFSYSYVDNYDFYVNSGLKVDEHLLGLLLKPIFWLIIVYAIFIKLFLFVVWFRLIKKEKMSFLKSASLATVSVLVFFSMFLIIWNLGFLVLPPGRAFGV